MADRISGKLCVLTDAGSGTGRATAVRFATEGGRVVCADIDGDAAAATAAAIDDTGNSSSW